MISDSDKALGKILALNNNVEHEDYGHDVYYHEPDVCRGAERAEKGRMKEKLEAQLEAEKDKFK